MEAESLRVVPSGQSGEICFGGVLAKRYWHLPELTASKFVDTAHRFQALFERFRCRRATISINLDTLSDLG